MEIFGDGAWTACSGSLHEPTEDELASVQMVLDIATLAQLKNDAKTPLGSFPAVVGAELTDHHRGLSVIDDAEFTQLVATWSIDGTRAAPALSAEAPALRVTARLACGADLLVEEQRAEAERKVAAAKKHEMDVAVAVAAASVSHATGPSPPLLETGRRACRVFFCFFSALRRASWQYCIDYNTTSARLSKLAATPAAQVFGG